MGADGGYLFFREKEVRELLKENFDLWYKFTCHLMTIDVWKEDIDVCQWVNENIHYDFFRFPYGTGYDDLFQELELKNFDGYTNPPEEVWYCNSFTEELRFYRPWYFKYCFCHPDSWVFRDSKSGLWTIPNPEELDILLECCEQVCNNITPDSVETWT